MLRRQREFERQIREIQAVLQEVNLAMEEEEVDEGVMGSEGTEEAQEEGVEIGEGVIRERQEEEASDGTIPEVLEEHKIRHEEEDVLNETFMEDPDDSTSELNVRVQTNLISNQSLSIKSMSTL